MIKMRLIRLLDHAKKYIVFQVIWQWIALLAQIVMTWRGAVLIADAWQGTVTSAQIWMTACVIGICVLVEYLCDRMYSDASYHASADVKRILRDKIYEKMLRLGASYRQSVHSSEVVQMATDGVEQLETYFGKYLSQFFYALLAPLTLFLVLFQIDRKASVILLAAVPLIPIVIMVVMIVARKLLSSYFDIYYGLGDSFLEKLQGMTTLKIYQADQAAADDMDKESEKFRKITMKVLTMQLNSTSIMDIVAYGGSAVGIVTALREFSSGSVTPAGTIMIILLALQFFLPMRILGSYFHIGMNGMKASDRIFAFLDLPEPASGTKKISQDQISISLEHVHFSYEKDRDVLKDLSMNFSAGSFTSIVGVSGSGKSTIASIVMGRLRNYTGRVLINNTELSEISEESLMKHFTMISHDSWIFKGTVRDNLLMGNPDASEDKMNRVLDEVNLLGFVNSQNGLDTVLESNGANLSGGQRQRLALARALLHDTPVYVFDEATSNIDAESEEMIMKVIHKLAQTHTVILISHRLANVTESDEIYLLKDGVIAESGSHEQLMKLNGAYAQLYLQQKELESYGAHVQEVQA